MKKLLIILAVILLQGCSLIDMIRPDPIIRHETITVKVPVYIKQKPPEILTNHIDLDFPAFIDPSDTSASSALDVEGERKTKLLLIRLTDQIKAWRNFYSVK